MAVSGSNFLRGLKGSTLLPFYYFYGEEDFLIEKGITGILDKALPGSAREFNLDKCYAEDVNISFIIDTAKTLPVFSSKRVIIVKGCEIFKSDHYNMLLPYIEDPSPSTVLVFVGGKCDMRNRFFKIIDGVKGLIECPALQRREVASWVRKELKGLGKEINDPALQLLIESAGRGLRGLSSEIDKLAIFAGDRTLIDEGDIEMLSPKMRVVGMFEYIDALADADTEKAFKMLSRLVEEGEPPLKILVFIARHFRILLTVKFLERKRCLPNEITKKLRLPHYLVKRYIQQSRGFAEQTLFSIYTKIFSSDGEIKKGLMPPSEVLKNLTLELLLTSNPKGYAPLYNSYMSW